MKYKGVVEDRRNGKSLRFIARLWVGHKASIAAKGGFKTARDAALAYDDLARAFYGIRAALNFPRPGEKATYTVECRCCSGEFEVEKNVPLGKGFCSPLCKKEYQKEWQRQNRKKKPELVAKHNESRRVKNQRDPDHRRAVRREWTAKRVITDPEWKERKRAYMTEWNERNIERVRERNRRKYLREAAAIQAMKNLGLTV